MKKSVNQDFPKFRLSENGLKFVKKYALPALSIKNKIIDETEEKIFDYAKRCELNMLDDDGKDRTDNYPEKERDSLADKYVTEVSLAWSSDCLLDLDDLNERLNF